jgi:hypothetical protein
MTVKSWNNSNQIAGFAILNLFAGLNDLTAELVPRHAGKRREG